MLQYRSVSVPDEKPEDAPEDGKTIICSLVISSRACSVAECLREIMYFTSATLSISQKKCVCLLTEKCQRIGVARSSGIFLSTLLLQERLNVPF